MRQFVSNFHRRSSNPQTPHPIWKDICPCKSSIWRLTLSNSSVVDFYPWCVISIETQNCFCEEQALFFSTIDFCRYLLLRRRGCDFCKFGFDVRASVDFIVHFFVTVIPVFRSSFPKFWICLKFRFRINRLSFSKRRFGNLFPSVPSSRCCEGFALLSSSAGTNYLWT